MAEHLDLDMAEVQSLRDEITSRIGLMNALVALELAAAGTGLTILHDSTHILAGLAAISSFLWLLWMDQSLSTYKIAAYLAIDLAPRLRDLTGRPALGWEYFLRRLDAGGQESARALYRGSPPPTEGIVRSIRADWYVPLLFGLAPPLLLALYVKAGIQDKVAPGVVASACLAGALLWLLTLSRFTDFIRNSRIIDNAILAADPPPDPEP